MSGRALQTPTLANEAPAIVKVVGVPNESFVIGYPGLPETNPRVEGKVVLRPSSHRNPLMILSMVTVHISRTESAKPPSESTFKFSKSKEKLDERRVGPELQLWRAKHRTYEEITAMDIPFCIRLPDDPDPTVLPASIALKSPEVRTFYHIVVRIQFGPQLSHTFRFPLPIVRYDSMTTLPRLNMPITAKAGGQRSINWLETTVKKRAYARGEAMMVAIMIGTNRAFTLEKWSYAVIEQYIRYDKNGHPKSAKPTVLLEKKEPDNRVMEGFLQTVEIRLPGRTRGGESSSGYPLIAAEDEPGYEVPEHARVGFTTCSRSYELKYYLEVKAHLAELSSPLTTKQEIIICPLTRRQCHHAQKMVELMRRQPWYADDPHPFGNIEILKPKHHRQVMELLGIADSSTGMSRRMIEAARTER
ncbi:hypothetical protein KEM52_000587 [Ascosphaera acerosa]|nr:hypothetical protein KEM52_000587 [Ascosphaera acerosa]